MIHPDTELRFISPEIGYGVVATKLIPKGTITWIFDQLDHVFTPAEVEEMHQMMRDQLNKYTYRDHKGNFVLCWDKSKYVNHSFHSNCISTAYNFELAIRDIQPGEELTDDYGYLNVTEPFVCVPEPDTDRTLVMPDDLLRYHERWDALLIAAFKRFNAVPQPLSYFLDPQFKEKVMNVAAGREEMDSILNCYFSGNTKVMENAMV